jgi:very-short-patch-repair endonuclease
VVEVDGWQGHRTRAQLENERQRDLELRIAGYVVLRYTWHQLTGLPNLVAAEVRRVLARPQARD